MTISAKIIADSIAPSGVRLTTFELKYPRFIHAEFMTHRVFSRNASSSRAIPLTRQIDMIENDIAYPHEFRKNQPGMQGTKVLGGSATKKTKTIWTAAAHEAIGRARQLAELENHKQVVNRLIEPYSHIKVVCTATDYTNFFALRHHHMADPTIAELAKQMWEEYKKSIPETLLAGEWHLPYVDIYGEAPVWGAILVEEQAIRCSVSRCARVSYNRHDGSKPTQEDDNKLYKRLLGAQPIHASPAEHQAQAVGDSNIRSGNFRGWIQYRQTLDGQNITEFKEPE